MELTCLMPNGIIVLLPVNYNATLAAIKEVSAPGRCCAFFTAGLFQDLWDKAERFPLYGKLQTDMSQYLFKVVNAMAEEEELNDESRRLCDIRPTGGVLIISECKLNSADHSVNVVIGNLIGKGLQDFDAFNSSEINEFRFNMRQLGERIVDTRNQGSTQDMLFYQFPPRISENQDSSLRDVTRMRVAIKCDNVETEDVRGPMGANEPDCDGFGVADAAHVVPVRGAAHVHGPRAAGAHPGQEGAAAEDQRRARPGLRAQSVRPRRVPAGRLQALRVPVRGGLFGAVCHAHPAHRAPGPDSR